VSILDGGLPRWVAEGYETETSDTPNFVESQYVAADADKDAIRSYEQIVENTQKSEDAEVVLEHRALARYVYTQFR
jgi:thiosulfate/3-mercaptopyruvate sulfurtransferase